LELRLSQRARSDATPSAPAENRAPAVAPEPEPEPEAALAVPAVVATGSNAPEDTNVWPDEAAEAAFLAEARDRGEPVRTAPASVATAEENGTKELPRLDDLVKRIPPEARELLDDLFRARFTAVRRVKKTDLKA
jgi:hypothetical protein